MDAQTLFREGVLAIREKKDVQQGRKLLTESLRLDPNNEMGWLWLSRTTSDPQMQLFCVERALSLNPQNQQALALKNRLTTGAESLVSVVAPALSKPESDERVSLSYEDDEEPEEDPQARRNPFRPQRKLSKEQEQRIKVLLNKAQAALEKEDTESAIEQWVRVLEIQVDHEIAMGSAVRHLSRLKYVEDAKELVWRAINDGTTVPSIYLTAIDIARYERDYAEADHLREVAAGLPTADDEFIAIIAEHFIKDQQTTRAQEVLAAAIQRFPKSQRLLALYGDVLRDMGRDKEAMSAYDQAARMGVHTRFGKDADQKILEHAPLLTDRERGSAALAWREALGFGVFFLLLGWQDAGLNLLGMDLNHWLGVLLALVGGYFVITATSSPQQQPLAGWLGGQVRETAADDENPSDLPIIPDGLRVVFGIVGMVALVIAFGLVFSGAIQQLQNPVRPYVPTVDEIWAEFGARVR
jgi:tetratricopeptide (TPR) repeat protein